MRKIRDAGQLRHFGVLTTEAVGPGPQVLKLVTYLRPRGAGLSPPLDRLGTSGPGKPATAATEKTRE